MTEFVWKHFGILEWLLVLQLVVLMAAGFFYQVAKLIARQDRRDPLVLFYRVFWRSFFSPVSSVKQIDLMMAESMARDLGLAAGGRMGEQQLSQLDAPDLGDLDALRTPDAPTPAEPPTAKPIGRTGAEDDPRLRSDDEVKKPNAGAIKPAASESRESRFARKQRESRQAAPAPKKRDRDEEPEERRAQTSRFKVRIVGFAKADRIVGQEAGEIVVETVHAPEDGQANGKIIELLSERIGVRPYQVSLVGGHYKVRKTLQVAGLDQPTLEQRLQTL